MPVRHLDHYTIQKCQTQPLSTLRDIRLGIDGNVWLRKIITSTSEQYLGAIGGTPSTLRAAIEKELENFKTASIHPLFVFSGLSLIRKEKPSVSDDLKIAKRNAAWDAYYAGKLETQTQFWSSLTSLHQPDLFHLVFRILREHNVDYLRAPYGTCAQLAYLEKNPKQIIHAIYAGSEALMFDVDRVITHIDFNKQTFSVIAKSLVLQDLQLSDEQFLDLCLLAGYDHCPPFPLFSTIGSYAIKSISDLLKQHRTGFNAIQAHANNNEQVFKPNYGDLFWKMRFAVRHLPVLSDDGHVKPMNAEQAPSDIHEFIGFCLPDELYYYLSRGMISEATLNTLVCGHGAEYSPLCNGETKEYRNLLNNDIMKMKAQTLALLTSQVHQYYQRKISIVFWYDGTSSTEHTLKIESAPVTVDAIMNWKSGKLSAATELKKAGIARPQFSFCLKLVADTADAASTVLAKGGEAPVPVSEIADVQARQLLKLMQLRSFVDASHVPTRYGKAILEGFKAHPSSPAEYQEALFVALELLRSELLSSRPYSHNYSKKTTIENEAAIKAIRLVSRVSCLLGARFKGVKPWAGPMNRDLLVFSSMSKLVTRNLRHLGEAVLVNMLLANECAKEDLDYTELATSLPFAHEPSTVLALLVKQYLESLETSEGGVENAEKAVQQTEEQCGATSLSTLADGVKEELQRAFSFWDVVYDAVRSLSGTISKELSLEFEESNSWLKTRRF
ncbi:hypothetical protein BGW38_010924 [Lunasporangiospora selenospora]|uniref:XPG N-terminal domain-containing protein n=1 Tax=Lunasporangiospora selenospora TaxID=979761 RepID=A0A9P6KFB9_9FUNG|nr:hypothetical protein BGW38_010924 [Lunasporangiospora selenospora]